jgi:FKBP-type peptidyl-prolyl cis-trans isomerase 2
MTGAKKGDRINLKCEIKLEDGTICYKTEEEDSLQFTLGEDNFLPKIESELFEMEEGQSKVITLEPEEAFGPFIEDLLIEAPKNVFKSEVELEVGSKVKINTPSGENYYGIITELSEEKLKLNLNHPLAGKKLIIDLKLDSIKDEQTSPEKKPLFKFNRAKKKQKKEYIKLPTSPSETK